LLGLEQGVLHIPRRSFYSPAGDRCEPEGLAKHTCTAAVNTRKAVNGGLCVVDCCVKIVRRLYSAASDRYESNG
jgi:hypothetical protein